MNSKNEIPKEINIEVEVNLPKAESEKDNSKLTKTAAFIESLSITVFLLSFIAFLIFSCFFIINGIIYSGLILFLSVITTCVSYIIKHRNDPPEPYTPPFPWNRRY